MVRSIYITDAGDYEVIETGEGYLKAKVTIARAGVFPYLEGDNIVMKAKLPEDLSSKETMDSARGAPVTENHPTDKDGDYVEVTPDNAFMFVKGNISEPIYQDNKIIALETLHDAELIAKVKAGEKREVSIGFVFDEERTPGSFNGQAYQAVQRNIRINHVAHVDRGRQGREVKIHIDREDLVMGKDKAQQGQPDAYTWRTIDGVDISVSKEAHTELTALKAKASDAEDKLKERDEEIKALKKTDGKDKDKAGDEDKTAKKIEELEGKLQAKDEAITKLQTELKQTKDEMPNLVADAAKARTELEAHADAAGIAHDGLADKDIKLQVIAKHLPFKSGLQIDALSEERIDAQFDAAMQVVKAKGGGQAQGGDGQGSKGADQVSHDEDIKQRRQKMGAGAYDGDKEEGGK